MTINPEVAGGFDPQEYLNDLTPYVPFVWAVRSDMLDPGSVIHVQPRSRDDWVYIFECTGVKGGKVTTGFLTKFKFLDDGTVVHEAPINATVNTIHPSPYLAQENTPYLEFVVEEEGKKTTIRPPGSEIKRAFSATLARQVFDQEELAKFKQPFAGSDAQAALKAVVGYLRRTEGGNDQIDTFTAAADIIEHDFVVESGEFGE